MKRVNWNNVLSFLALAGMAMMMVWMAIRDIDKDVERECGYRRYEDAPSYCESWWDDKGVEPSQSLRDSSPRVGAETDAPMQSTRNERSNETAHDMQR